MSLFTPALLFSKVRRSLCFVRRKLILGGLFVDSGQAQGDVDHPSWVRVANVGLSDPTLICSFVVVSGLSALVAWVLAKIFKLKKSQT